ncbi:MAG: type I-E CRISPR-associated protein Cas6/Cse3/CasE [Steroidobacteraceae bacterium]
MLLETVLPLEQAPETLYALHQRVWRMLWSSSDQGRDYLYALDRARGELYVRTTNARESISGWREMPPLVQGRRYVAVGALAIDATRTRVRGQETLGWRHPVVLDRRVRPMFELFMRLDSLSIRPARAEPFGKDGHQRIYFTPLHVRAEGTVTDAAAANSALERGLGRARAFGFGTLHFAPID